MLYDLIPGYLQGITRVLISYPFDNYRLHLQTENKNHFKIKYVYKGVILPLTIIPIDRSLSFFIYEKLNKKYPHYIASSLTSFFTCLYSVPLQSFNNNYILNKKQVNHYKSYGLEYLRIFSMSTIYMGTYGILRDKNNNPAINGITANLVAWTIMYPLDTLKAQHQTSCLTIKNLLYKNTIRSYYNGIGVVYLRTVPSAGMGMYVYEKSRQYFS